MSLLSVSVRAEAPAPRGVKLNWMAVTGASGYELELGGAPGLSPPLIARKLEIPSIETKLPPGSYYYRVRALLPSGEPGPWSDVRGFALNPFPPKALEPLDGAVFREESLPEDGLLLRWHSGLAASEYVLEIAGEDVSAKPLRESPKKPEFRFEPERPGHYRWRVGYLTSAQPEWGKWREFRIEPKPGLPSTPEVATTLPPGPDFRLTAGLGTSILSYHESDTPDFGELALTWKGSVSYAPTESVWSGQLSAYATLLGVKRERGLTGDPSVRFLGLNLRAGPRLGLLRASWSLQLLGGYYFTTMMVGDGSFGFRNMHGPQLFPLVTRELGERSGRLSAYLKFSPVSPRLGALSFRSSEVAMGGAWSFPLGLPGERTRLGLSLDLSSLRLLIGEVRIRSNSYTMGVEFSY
ncbi:MAG: hypothetical protein NDJ89_11100 [Oligoflexia bacterium]|nr:hypothetical protein [Oligoflexia bacterium]